MEEPLHDYMRVGIVQFMVYPACFGGSGPQLETVTEIACNPFFDIVEIGPINDPDVRSQVISVMSQARVEAVYDGQPLTLIPGLNLESEDNASRQTAIEAMKGGIDEAAEVGSKTCGVMSGKAYPPGLDYAKATARLADSLKELCDYARPKAITLCLENFDRVPYSKDCLIGPTPEAAKLAEMVCKEYDNFGLIIDLSHSAIMGEQPRFMIEAAKDFIVRTQIGNCSTNPYSQHYGDNHAYFGAPLTSVSIEDLTEFLAAMLETGFISKEKKGIVSFEVKPLSSESSKAIIAGSIRALKQAWRDV